MSNITLWVVGSLFISGLAATAVHLWRRKPIPAVSTFGLSLIFASVWLVMMADRAWIDHLTSAGLDGELEPLAGWGMLPQVAYELPVAIGLGIAIVTSVYTTILVVRRRRTNS